MPKRKAVHPRKKPLQQRSRDMVGLILEAATRVFIEEGYEAASTNQIARRAGISVGSLYQYFPNKESIAAALYDQLSEKAAKLTQERLQKLIRRPLRQAIPEAIGVLVELYESSPRLIESTLPRLSELERTRNFEAHRERSAAMLLAFLESRRDELREGDLPHMAWIVSFATESLVFRIMQAAPPHLSKKKLLQQTGELISRYLLAAGE